MNKQVKIVIGLMGLLIFNACATYELQTRDQISSASFPQDKIFAHSFYLIGDAGNSSQGVVSPALQAFTAELTKASDNSTAVF